LVITEVVKLSYLKPVYWSLSSCMVFTMSKLKKWPVYIMVFFSQKEVIRGNNR